MQDGSGFPYWDVFVIDLKANELGQGLALPGGDRD